MNTVFPGELPKFTEEKWLRSRSNRGSFGMMAAAVAQVVVGNNNVPQELSGTGPMGNMNQIHQNTSNIHNLTERRCSGPEANSIMPDNKTINTSNDNDLNGNNDSPGSQSEVTCNIHKNPVDSVRIKNEINDHPSTSRFISDGISQLTMGSFQVMQKNCWFQIYSSIDV